MKSQSGWKYLLNEAKKLEDKADSLRPCDANLGRHARLMEQAESLRARSRALLYSNNAVRP